MKWCNMLNVQIFDSYGMMVFWYLYFTCLIYCRNIRFCHEISDYFDKEILFSLFWNNTGKQYRCILKNCCTGMFLYIDFVGVNHLASSARCLRIEPCLATIWFQKFCISYFQFTLCQKQYWWTVYFCINLHEHKLGKIKSLPIISHIRL